MATRRKLLVGMGVGAMTSLLTGLYVPKSSSEAPWWLLGELKAGSFLGRGWFLSDISPVERGASVISLRKKTGEEARIHMCAHFGNPEGLTHTKYLDFLLMDGGEGNTPSDEDVGCVILSLVERIRASEGEMVANFQYQLESHTERLSLYRKEGLT